jgi:predicted MFS family arabinose efflux permease
VLFGFGAAIGPMIFGHAADRFGFGPALRAGLAIEAAAVVLPAMSAGPVSLCVSSLLVGAFTPGIVPLVLGRIRELLPADGGVQQAAWSRATMAFALGQAAAAYGFSFLFAAGGEYPALFELNRVRFEIDSFCGLGWAARVPIWSPLTGGDRVRVTS